MSESAQTAKKLGLQNQILEVNRDLYRMGMASYDSNTGKYSYMDRGKVSVSQRGYYDTQMKKIADLQTALGNVDTQFENSRSSLISGLPQAIQDALAILKTRKADRATLATKEKAAKKIYDDTITKQLGRDAQGRPNISSAEDRKIADEAFATYMKNGGKELSLFDSRIEGLERNLKNAGFDRGKITSLIGQYYKGGMVMPKMFVDGGFAIGTDTVPAMLTPGEFVVSQPAVKSFGVDNLKAINSGTYGGDSVYNYSVNVNVANTGANPNDIARTVISQIRQIDAQRIRSNNL